MLSTVMTKREIAKIFFLSIITGNIMGMVIIQIFDRLTLNNFLLLELSIIIITVLLFFSSKAWNKRLEKSRKNQST